MAKPVKFAGKKPGPKGGSTSFAFGANVPKKPTGGKHRGGKGGGS